MTLFVQIIAVLFMLTMIFIGIWGFVIANKSYSQLKYKNYLLEKLSQNIALLRETTSNVNFDAVANNITDTLENLNGNSSLDIQNDDTFEENDTVIEESF